MSKNQEIANVTARVFAQTNGLDIKQANAFINGLLAVNLASVVGARGTILVDQHGVLSMSKGRKPNEYNIDARVIEASFGPGSTLKLEAAVDADYTHYCDVRDRYEAQKNKDVKETPSLDANVEAA